MTTRKPSLEPMDRGNFTKAGINVAGRVFNLLVVLANLWGGHLAAAPAHPHPYLMPPAEKQRLLERLRSSETARKEYEAIKARANQGKFADAALVFALEGGQKSSDTVRGHLLELVRYRSQHLDAAIARATWIFIGTRPTSAPTTWCIPLLRPKNGKPSRLSIASSAGTGKTALAGGRRHPTWFFPFTTTAR